jgi:hypothetical protein
MTIGLTNFCQNPVVECDDRVWAFLRREKAAPVKSLICVVHTREAYLANADVQKDQFELLRINESDATHVIVYLFAVAGPESIITPEGALREGPYRFIGRLAASDPRTEARSNQEIRADAAAIVLYDDKWCDVTDAD